MAAAEAELLSPLLRQRPRRICATAAIAAPLLLLLLLVLVLRPFGGTCCGRRWQGHPGSSPDLVELTLLADADDKGYWSSECAWMEAHRVTTCSQAPAPGHTTGLSFFRGGAWCDTIESCFDRKMGDLGSSKFMKPKVFFGILSSDQLQNPDFYNWNRVYVRYCDGASFAGNSQYEDKSGNKLFFRGLRIWEAVIDELMEKGLARSKQALLAGCSAGGLATLLHCNDFRARFPGNVLAKCLPDAGFFLDEKDISGERSIWSLYNGTMHLQNVTEVLPKDCLANKDPTECFFPAELIKSINAPTFIVNSGYDSWQIQNVVAPDSSHPDKSWQSCKNDIGTCNSTQMEVLHGLRKAIVDDLKVVEDKIDWGWFIDSCFTHCQTDGIAWNSPISPRLGNKTLSEAVGDWYFERGLGKPVVVREVDGEYPCNPTCHVEPYM
ncbi:hypothetical protein ACP70R_038540 [Stipagrostis hirtigluma subsp. patula]